MEGCQRITQPKRHPPLSQHPKWTKWRHSSLDAMKPPRYDYNPDTHSNLSNIWSMKDNGKWSVLLLCSISGGLYSFSTLLLYESRSTHFFHWPPQPKEKSNQCHKVQQQPHEFHSNKLKSLKHQFITTKHRFHATTTWLYNLSHIQNNHN